jgi:tetratricopeptide (TPR) repeat protein
VAQAIRSAAPWRQDEIGLKFSPEKSPRRQLRQYDKLLIARLGEFVPGTRVIMIPNGCFNTRRFMLPLMNLQRISGQAIESHTKGKLAEAERLYLQILTAEPANFDARHLLGVLRHQQGRNKEAQILIRAALETKPDYPEAMSNYGKVLSTLGYFEQALEILDKAIAIKPNLAAALYNRGNVFHSLRRFDEALASYEQALTIDPKLAEALNGRGNTLYSLRRLAEALGSYDKALTVNPDYAEALSNRGIVLAAMQRFGLALSSYAKALAIKPSFAEAWNNRGNSLLALKRLNEALASYDLALAAKPDFPEALNNRGNVLDDLGRGEEALVSYDKAIAIKPTFADAYFNRGIVLEWLGRFDEARASYVRSLTTNPHVAKVYLNYADSGKFSPDDPYLGIMEKMRSGGGALDDSDKVHLDFALAKAYADLNEYRRSFKYLTSGNALKRAQVQYDEAGTLAFFDRIEAIFTPSLVQAKTIVSNDAVPIPIFVFGMPRSGTTLVEQILASHPQVHGAGELKTLVEVAAEIRRPDGLPVHYPDFLADIDARALSAMGARYTAEISKVASGALYVTDKMPSNYQFAGLIHLMLPNARMIHVLRDPNDICVSCYSKLFTEGHEYTYDLAELGRYFRRYRKLMAHWRRVLPKDRILEIRYEDIVKNLEGEARRILAYCGLDWSPRCLSFYETDRPVRTASAAQVRRPIYDNAVGRSLVYDEFLGPLKENLAPPQDPHLTATSGFGFKPKWPAGSRLGR